LLRAAQEIFVAQGYHGAAMDDIADRAGVSKPVLYQHFPGKLELYLALLDTQIDGLIQRIRSALAATNDNRLRVEGAVGAYFDFVDSKNEAFRLLFESDLRNDPAVRERVRVFLQACVSATAVTIAEDTGASPARAQLLSAGLTGLAEMSARWWLDHRETIGKAEAVQFMSALAWRGISGFPLQDGGPPSAAGIASGSST
jgi:AcrR family transcriptional regulator